MPDPITELVKFEGTHVGAAIGVVAAVFMGLRKFFRRERAEERAEVAERRIDAAYAKILEQLQTDVADGRAERVRLLNEMDESRLDRIKLREELIVAQFHITECHKAHSLCADQNTALTARVARLEEAQ